MRGREPPQKVMLAEHEESVSLLITKNAPHRVTQPTGLPSWVIAVAPKYGEDRGKARQPSLKAADSSDDEPLPDKEPDPKPKGRKRNYTSPDVVVVDDDEPLSSTQKTPAKKAKTYTASEQETIDRLTLWLKSEGRHCQYSKEFVDLIKYQNANVPNLRQAPNTDNHSAYLATVKKKTWCYPAKGNLQTVKQFVQDLCRCGDPDKIEHAEKVLWDRGMPKIPQENTPLGTKRERIKARYVI